MQKTLIALVPVALIATAGTAAAQHRRDTVVPQILMQGTVRDFVPAAKGQGVYLRIRDYNWVYAAFDQNCAAVRNTRTIGFRPREGTDALDTGGQILAGDQICTVASIRPSDRPGVSGRIGNDGLTSARGAAFNGGFNTGPTNFVPTKP